MKMGDLWRSDHSAFALILAISLAAIFLLGMPIQAADSDAKEADPVVVPCKAINTATVNETLTITVFRCKPENGAPYLLNTVGFMKDEEY